MTHPKMLAWQYKVTLSGLSLLQEHAADPTCPCSQFSIGEWCMPKHALHIAGLAAETAAMDEPHADMWFDLQAEANDLHEKLKKMVCGHGKSEDIVSWARAWRKRVEQIYYACDVKAKPAHLHADVLATFPVCATASLHAPARKEQAAQAMMFQPVCGSVKKWYENLRKGDVVVRESDKKEFIVRKIGTTSFRGKTELEFILEAPNGYQSVWPPLQLDQYFSPKKQADLHDPLLAEIATQICSTGACFASPRFPVCRGSKVEKFERCVREVKARDGKVNPFAVCTTSLKCHVKAGVK